MKPDQFFQSALEKAGGKVSQGDTSLGGLDALASTLNEGGSLTDQ